MEPAAEGRAAAAIGPRGGRPSRRWRAHTRASYALATPSVRTAGRPTQTHGQKRAPCSVLVTAAGLVPPGAPGPLPVSRGPGAARREGPLVSGKGESWGINKYQGPCGELKALKNDPTRLLQTPGLTPSYAVVDLIINCIPETPRSKTSAAIQDSHWPRWHV